MATTMKPKRFLSFALVVGLIAAVPVMSYPRATVAAQGQSETPHGKPAKPAKQLQQDKAQMQQAKQAEKLQKQQAKEQAKQQEQSRKQAEQQAKQQKQAQPAANPPTSSASQQSTKQSEKPKKEKAPKAGASSSTTTTTEQSAPATSSTQRSATATTTTKQQVTTTSGPAPKKSVHYEFRTQDRATIRQHYQTQLSSIDVSTRPVIVQNTYIVREYVSYIQPCPNDVLVLLAPPPPGYVIGFWYGYIIVYDPGTLFISAVFDLA